MLLPCCYLHCCCFLLSCFVRLRILGFWIPLASLICRLVFFTWLWFFYHDQKTILQPSGQAVLMITWLRSVICMLKKVIFSSLVCFSNAVAHAEHLLTESKPAGFPTKDIWVKDTILEFKRASRISSMSLLEKSDFPRTSHVIGGDCLIIVAAKFTNTCLTA